MMSDYFFEYMQGLLGERYDDFLRAYKTKPRHRALRVNTLKISVGEFTALCGGMRRNALCPSSLYADVKPSLDPLYHAGLYYMQEPSASAAVAAFVPYIGERVLDLCAAPGGKCTQVAQDMRGGVLFCNDPDYKRTRALTENIERLGISNAVVTCNVARDYVNAGFGEYFDTLVCDVPCSGGGMMRYERVPYSKSIIDGCAARQRDILSDGVKLLCRGGYMLYSTCTFSREENEDNIAYLCSLGLETVDIPLLSGAERGIGCSNARRVYPMDFDGEGHFYCVLRKTVGGVGGRDPAKKKSTRARFDRLDIPTATIDGYCILPIDGLPRLDGLNVLRIGTPVFGEGKEPSHALIHALDSEDLAALGTVELGDCALDYLAGKQIASCAPLGFSAACYRGYALGLVKSARDGSGEPALKNKYPKPLRIPDITA